MPPDSIDFVPGVEVSTLTGNAGLGLTDGTLALARFSNPVNLTQIGQSLFVTDYDNAAVRAIDLVQGTVTTLYQAASFCQPFGIVAGGAAELIVETDCGRNTDIYAGPRDGTVWRLSTAATPVNPENILEPNGRPRGLLYVPPDTGHAKGRLVFSDVTNHIVGVLDLDSLILSPLAGSSGNAGYVDGVGAEARFSRPYGLALFEGDIVVSDFSNRVLRRVGWDGTVTTLAGTGQPGLVDGPVESALFAGPQDVAADAAGNLFVSDYGSHRVRVIHQGIVRTLAGSSWDPGFLDGAGQDARFFGQEGLDVTSDGRTLYVADGNGGDGSPFYNHIRVITVPPLD
jgi:DNA-binding beta-propeller fold protein YncE